MHQIHFALRGLYIASVTGFLQNRIRIVIFWFQMIRVMAFIGFSGHRSQDRILRVLFIRSPDVP